MYNPFQNAGIFLLNTIFGIYITLLLLRFLLQILRADFYNPVCQLLVKITNPLLTPLRRVIPGFFGIDFAAIVLLFILQFVLIYALNFIISGGILSLNIFSILKGGINPPFSISNLNLLNNNCNYRVFRDCWSISSGTSLTLWNRCIQNNSSR